MVMVQGRGERGRFKKKMAQEREEEEGEKGGEEETSRLGVTSLAPCSPPSSSLKRPVSSTSSHSSSLPEVRLRPRKKTRDLPDLSKCHICGLQPHAKGGRDTLQTLRSQWRVLLLCQKCLKSIRSAEFCSYCFSEFPNGDGGSIDCRECSCRVHLRCVPGQRGYVVPSELDPELFTCIDCCAIPKFRGRKPSDFAEVLSPRVSRVSLEEIVRDANSSMVKKVEAAARAKEKALKKALAARFAAELARNALELAVLAAKEPQSIVESMVPDEQLAFRLHRSMNGSHRISKNQCSVSSDHSIYPNKGSDYGYLLCRESESWRFSNCQRVEFCMENKLCETLESSDHELLSNIEQTDGVSSLILCATRRKDQGRECTEQSILISAEMPGNEEQISCSDKIVNSSGNDKTVESNIALTHF